MQITPCASVSTKHSSCTQARTCTHLHTQLHTHTSTHLHTHLHSCTRTCTQHSTAVAQQAILRYKQLPDRCEGVGGGLNGRMTANRRVVCVGPEGGGRRAQREVERDCQGRNINTTWLCTPCRLKTRDVISALTARRTRVGHTLVAPSVPPSLCRRCMVTRMFASARVIRCSGRSSRG